MQALFCVSLFFIIACVVSGEKFSWTSADAAAQADKTTCKPLQKYENAALKSTENAKDVQRTSLGAVDNAQVCGGLCCEMENCDLAEFNKLKQCYAVQCSNLKSCDIDSNGDATILTFSRKTGADVWTRSFKAQASKPVAETAVGNQPSSPVVEQHPSNTVNGVQKSQIPDQDNASKKSEPEKSVMDIINDQQIAKIESLTKELEEAEKMEKEVASVNANSKKDNIVEKQDDKLGSEISSITGQHYLKADDKDITSFQENDTSTAHSKHQHQRDVRHNLISPITIGAFTCMAVIAVSGFAMAIIKYKKERREGVDDKQTQSP